MATTRNSKQTASLAADFLGSFAQVATKNEVGTADNTSVEGSAQSDEVSAIQEKNIKKAAAYSNKRAQASTNLSKRIPKALYSKSGEDLKVFNVKLPKSLHKQFSICCKASDVTINDKLFMMISEEVKGSRKTLLSAIENTSSI